MRTKKKAPQTLFGKQIQANPEAHLLMVGLNMVGLNVNIPACELILRAQESIKQMNGKFDLMTAAKIQVEVEEKYAKIESDFNNQTKK